MITMIVMFAVLSFLFVGWVLHTNAKDRERFEKELEEYLADDPEGRP